MSATFPVTFISVVKGSGAHDRTATYQLEGQVISVYTTDATNATAVDSFSEGDIKTATLS